MARILVSLWLIAASVTCATTLSAQERATGKVTLAHRLPQREPAFVAGSGSASRIETSGRLAGHPTSTTSSAVGPSAVRLAPAESYAAEIICPDGAGGYERTTAIPNDPHGDGCYAAPADVSQFFTATPYDCSTLRPGLFYLGGYSFNDGGSIAGRKCQDVRTPEDFRSIMNFGPREQMVAIVHNDIELTETTQVPYLSSRGELLVIGIPDSTGKPPAFTHDAFGTILNWQVFNGNLALVNLVNVGEIAFGSAHEPIKQTLTLVGITHRGSGRLVLTRYEGGGGNWPNDPTLAIDDEVYFKNVLVARSVWSHNVYLDRNGLQYIEGLISYGNVNTPNHALKLTGRMVFLYGSYLSSAGVHGNLLDDDDGQSPLSSVACQVGVVRGNKLLDAVNRFGGVGAATAQIRVAIAGCDYPQGFLSNTYPTKPYTGPLAYRGRSYANSPFWDPSWWAGVQSAGTTAPELYRNPDMLVTYYLDNTFEVLVNGSTNPNNYYGIVADPTFPTGYPSYSQSSTPRFTNAPPPPSWFERSRRVLVNNCFIGGNPSKVANHWPPRLACDDSEVPVWGWSWPACLDGDGPPDDTDKFVMIGANECGQTDPVPPEVSGAIAVLEAIPDPPWRHWQGANQRPQIRLTSPVDGETHALGTDIELEAMASDSDGAVVEVAFAADGVLLGVVTSEPYRLTWSGAPLGGHVLRAEATDDTGAKTTSPAVIMTVAGDEVVVLQDSASGYSGTRDAYLASANQDVNFGGSETLVDLSGRYLFESLVRFAIFQSEGGPVPDGAAIQSAKLELYKYSYYDQVYRAHRLLRDWRESEVTWTERVDGVRWSEPGANGFGTDVATTADGESEVGWDPQWLEIDVTSGVAAMSAGTANYGWKLVDVAGNDNVKKFHSRETTTGQEFRPRLTLTYSLAPTNASPSVNLTSPSGWGNTRSGNGHRAGGGGER